LILELEFDFLLELQFLVPGRFPSALHDLLGERKEELYRLTRPHPLPSHGSFGELEVEVEQRKFLVIWRLGRIYLGDSGDQVQPVRIIRIREIPAATEE
jgi:hypothetical protein